MLALYIYIYAPACNVADAISAIGVLQCFVPYYNASDPSFDSDIAIAPDIYRIAYIILHVLSPADRRCAELSGVVGSGPQINGPDLIAALPISAIAICKRCAPCPP